MASKTFEGNLKVWRLEDAPASWGDPEGSRTVTATEIAAGTRLLRLPSDSGFAFTQQQGDASQALVDNGKVSHAGGVRDITGAQVTHESDFPRSGDAMWSLYTLGETAYYVVAPNAIGNEIPDGEIVTVIEAETGEKQTASSARDTIQNHMIPLFVQDWDVEVVYDAESSS